jgi:hypothetical protein
VEIAFFMELLEADDNFSQNFSGLLKGEDSVLKFSLVVDKISTVAVLEEEIDADFVLKCFIQLDNILGIHGLHAFYLPV